jgi:glycosyltransferase involved in cell wall biosynthesis
VFLKISLIVCTKNRARFLPFALESLSRLKVQGPWELIVVNNGSTDNTQVLLENFAQSDVGHVKLVYEARAGLANAQNAGLLVATGDIIAFTDDDCYPEPDFLEQIKTCFAEGSISYLGGRVLLFDPQDAAITIQTRENRVEMPPFCFVPTGAIHGAAFAFTRATLDQLGGFDPDLGIGGTLNSGNDINALIRCSALGLAGAYDPRPVVYHHHHRKPGLDEQTLMKRYDVSRGAAYYLGIASPTTRANYLWPVCRHLLGNMVTGKWALLSRELSGAYRYARIMSRRRVQV